MSDSERKSYLEEIASLERYAAFLEEQNEFLYKMVSEAQNVLINELRRNNGKCMLVSIKDI